MIIHRRRWRVTICLARFAGAVQDDPRENPGAQLMDARRAWGQDEVRQVRQAGPSDTIPRGRPTLPGSPDVFKTRGDLILSWDQRFSDPIPVPNRKPIATLRDAREYTNALPMAEQNTEQWQTTAEILMLISRARRRPDGGTDRDDAGAAQTRAGSVSAPRGSA
jgi:hypothetical protein